MKCRLFLFLGGLLSLQGIVAGIDTPKEEQSLSVSSATTVIPGPESPELKQRTDISLRFPQGFLFLPSPRFRLYTHTSTPLAKPPDTGMDKRIQEYIVPDILGLGMYSKTGNNRLLFGSLSVKGPEKRLKDLWSKAFALPASYTRSGAELRRSTSTVQTMDLASLITIPLGQTCSLYTLFHWIEMESINATFGFETVQVDERTMRMELLLASRLLPETAADTWFASAPLLPQRRQYHGALSLQRLGPRLMLVGDLASSYTEWEGLGWYYKGAFSLGPPSFRLSGGAETIHGPFRDTAGAPLAEESRGRLHLAMRSKELGSLALNTEVLFRSNEIGDILYYDKVTGSVRLTRGRRLSTSWLVPASLQLTGSYTSTEEIPYTGSVTVTHKTEGNRLGVKLTNKGSLSTSQAIPWSEQAQLQRAYSIDARLFMLFGNTRMQLGTQWETGDDTAVQGSINLDGTYKSKNLQLSASIDLPVYNSTAYKASLSVTWSR